MRFALLPSLGGGSCQEKEYESRKTMAIMGAMSEAEIRSDQSKPLTCCLEGFLEGQEAVGQRRGFLGAKHRGPEKCPSFLIDQEKQNKTPL